MRIVLVSGSNSPGMQEYAVTLATELARENDVCLVTSKHMDLTRFRTEPTGGVLGQDGSLRVAPVIGTRGTRLEPGTLNLPALARTVMTIRAFQPDIVHFVSPHPWNFVLPRMVGARTVVTIHDPIPHEGEAISPWVSWYNRAIFAGLADGILLHAQKWRDWLVSRKLVSEGRIGLAPLAVPARGVGRTDQTPPALPEKPAALFFGRIRPYKGLEYFLKACAAVAQKVPEARFLVAGNGDLSPYQDLIRDCPRLTVINRLIQDRELPELFNQVTVLVLSHVSATQSGLIPTAYSFGRPVVATRVGALPEAVEDEVTGLLVPPQDSRLLASAIAQLLSDPIRAGEMGRRGFRKYHDELSPGQMAAGVVKFYRAVLG